MVGSTQASFSGAKLTGADLRQVVVGESRPLLHDAAVRSIAVKDNLIVAGCDNGSLHLWALDSGEVCKLGVLAAYSVAAVCCCVVMVLVVVVCCFRGRKFVLCTHTRGMCGPWTCRSTAH